MCHLCVVIAGHVIMNEAIETILNTPIAGFQNNMVSKMSGNIKPDIEVCMKCP